MVEEIKEPLAKNILMAVAASFGTVTVLYMLTNFAYMAVLPTAEFLSSEAVAISFSFKIFAGLFWLMPFFVACSTLGTIHMTSANLGIFYPPPFLSLPQSHNISVTQE